MLMQKSLIISMFGDTIEQMHNIYRNEKFEEFIIYRKIQI